MSLDAIYVVRHGFRSTWTVDPVSGRYSSHLPTPTGLPADPSLTSHGVHQSRELAAHLLTVHPPIDAVYSSPYYRCLQTIAPYVSFKSEQLSRSGSTLPESERCVTIRAESGLAEFFGEAPFDQPTPAEPSVLKSFFPAYDETYQSLITPSRKGESILELYDRVSAAVRGIVQQCDAEGIRSVVLCTHAAVVIALGRILTGQIPEDVSADDFRAFTCGLSVYRRDRGRYDAAPASRSATKIRRPSGDLDTASQRDNPDVRVESGASASSALGATRSYMLQGGWVCEANSDCSFLSGGEERGWAFTGDESFTSNTQSTRERAGAGPVGASDVVGNRGGPDHSRL